MRPRISLAVIIGLAFLGTLAAGLAPRGGSRAALSL